MRPTPQRVLVVEDDAMIQTFLALHLKNEELAVSRAATGGEMFGALAAAGINIQMINTSEIRISVVVGLADGPAGHACLAKTFDL